MTVLVAHIASRARHVLGLDLPPYIPAKIIAAEGAGTWFPASIYAWITMLAALLSAAVLLKDPVFVGLLGIIIVAAFPVATAVHYSGLRRHVMPYASFFAAVGFGALQFGSTFSTWLTEPPDDVYIALRALISVFLWITAFRAFSIRTVTELTQTILPTTSIVLLSLTAQPHYSSLAGMALLTLGALALLAIEHRVNTRNTYDNVGEFRFSRSHRSLGIVYSWPAIYLLALLVATGVGFWAARSELSTSVTEQISIYLARAVARHLTAHVVDFTPPASLWMPRFSPPSGRQIILEAVCERPENWRTACYTIYDGKTWRRKLPRKRISEQTADGTLSIPRQNSGIGASAVLTKATITPHVSFGSVIPAMLYPVSYNGSAKTIAYSVDGTLMPWQYGAGTRTYTIEILQPQTLPDATGIAFPASREELELNTQLPDDLAPEIAQLARQITTSSQSSFDKVRAIEQYLADSYQYDLTVSSTWPDELAYAFLFKTKRGYCIHFATAMVLMCRSIGIPARFAVGFTRGEAHNSQDDLYIVRSEDAHSWPEVYIPDGGWMAFEPTPAAREEQEQRTFGDVWSDTVSGIGTRAAVLTRWITQFSIPIALVASVMVLLGAAPRLRRKWNETHPPTNGKPLTQLIWAYTGLRKILAQRGGVDGPQVTAEELLADIPDELADIRCKAGELVRLYQMARFGDRAPDTDTASAAILLLAQIREHLRGRQPRDPHHVSHKPRN